MVETIRDTAVKDDKTGEATRINSIIRLVAALTAASLPVLLDRRAIAEAAGLYPLAASAHPYLILSHGVLLYLRAPVVVLSACVLLLTPGLLIALAVGMGRTMAVWVLAGFMLSLVIVSVGAGVTQAVIGAPLVAGAFAMTVAICSVGCLGFLYYQVKRGRIVDEPWSSDYAGTTVAAILTTSFLLLVALAPKFYWDSFNGDGAHTFEATRLLLSQSIPFFGPKAGHVSSFPGVTTMLYLYPGSWFLRLFGEMEASVRVPVVPYLSALICSIIALAESGRPVLGRAARWLICLGVTVYAITMAYSATYNPYSADIALPATQDTLLITMFLAYVLFFIEKRTWWMSAALVLTYLSLSSGALLIIMWLVAVLFWRPRPSRRFIQSAAVLVGCIVGGALLSLLLPALNLPPPGGEYGLISLLSRFAFLQFTDWHRFVYAIVPGSFLAVFALIGWNRLDAIGKSLALVAIGCFALFFIQGQIALHHFVPEMLLPLAVFWRAWGDLVSWKHPVLLTGIAAAALVAFVLSLPRDAAPQVASREVGFAVDDRTVGYEHSEPATFRRSELFAKLFPIDWDESVPERMFGGSPLVWLYYAHHAPSATRSTNYVLQDLREPAPDDARLIATDADAALYVRSDSVWARHLALRPPTPAGSVAYEVPRGILFRSERMENGPRIFNMVHVLGALGVDTARVLRRLGVKQ